MSLEHLRNVQKEEDEFVLSQLREAARIRIEGGRSKVFDMFIHISSAVESRVLITKSSKITIQELLKDIESIDDAELSMLIENSLRPFFMTLTPPFESSDTPVFTGEIDSQHAYWAIVKLILGDVTKQKKRAVDATGGVSLSVKEEVLLMLKSKSLHELNELETDLVRKIKRGGEIDYDYWDHIISSLRIWRAKLQLNLFLESISFECKKVIVHLQSNEVVDVTDNEEATRENYENYMTPAMTKSIDPEDAHLLVLEEDEDRARLVCQLVEFDLLV